jgi:AAA domain
MKMPSTIVEINLENTAIPYSQLPSKFGLTLAELEQELNQSPPDYIVESLLPSADVHVAVGDSGLGKTPWAYQLGLCVASGAPFLGHQVRQSPVLYFDMENSGTDILQLSKALCGHLGVGSFPRDFYVVANDGSPPKVEDAVAYHRPRLVIVDTLRALQPEAEQDNTHAGQFWQKYKRIAREHDCAILFLHHLRKPGEHGGTMLEHTATLDWLLQASGARGLINQTNTRIGLDTPRNSTRDDVALIMKAHVKVKGETGVIYLERVMDGSGEPIGYRRITGVGLLCNSEQEMAFTNLTPKFTFSQAKYTYGKTDNPTCQFLKKCEGVGLIRRNGRGMYEKL